MFKYLKDNILKNVFFGFSGILIISSNIISPITVEGNDIRVIDGDTIVVTQTLKQPEIRVRLACIDAPELKQPLGVQSKVFLETLIKNRTLTIYPFKVDIYGRSISQVNIGNRTLQQLMVFSGMAFVYKGYRKDCPEYHTLILQEQNAAEEKIGIWGQSQIVFPWDFRKKH